LIRFSLRIVVVLLCSVALSCASAGRAAAALIVNAARPITDRVNVNLISVADNDGTDSTAGTFGNATQRGQVFSLVDTIYSQAGVDVEFTFRAGTYNSSFARIGTPGNNSPRPQSDLSLMNSAAMAAGGVLSSNPSTINVFLVSIVPGFSQLGTNSAAGLASIGGNGVTYYGGSALAGFANGLEVLASVLAHEIGHNLGLSHNSLTENLMKSGGNGERLDAAQISTILASRFTVTAPPAGLAGDFSGDGRVDGRDFLIWQRGGSANRLSASDLALWRANFGRTSATAGAVPEPAGIVLAGILAATVPWRRWKRFHRRGLGRPADVRW
jgi:hypothetical protein